MAQAIPYLERLLDFAETTPKDSCLDLSYGPGPVPGALLRTTPRVASVDLGVSTSLETRPEMPAIPLAAPTLLDVHAQRPPAPDPARPYAATAAPDRARPYAAPVAPDLAGPYGGAPKADQPVRPNGGDASGRPYGAAGPRDRARPDHGSPAPGAGGAVRPAWADGPAPTATSAGVFAAVPRDSHSTHPGGRALTVEFDPHETGRVPAVAARATALPYRAASFTLVTARFALYRTGDIRGALREMLRVCAPGGRIVIADLIRPNQNRPSRDAFARLRDAAHPATPSLARLIDMVTEAGADVRRLEIFTVERPLDPWLAEADVPDPDRIRAILHADLDGGPRTGVRPRLIGGELWFTQNWLHLAASPVR